MHAERDDFEDGDLDYDELDYGAGPSQPATTSAPASTSAPRSLFDTLTTSPPFKAQQFEDKKHPHLAKAAKEISDMHKQLAPAMRSLGDQATRKAYSETERVEKMEEVATAVEGALKTLRDRNMDLAIRSAARDRQLPEHEVLRTARAHYGTLQDLDPELRVGLKGAIHTTSLLANNNNNNKHSSQYGGRSYGPTTHSGPPVSQLQLLLPQLSAASPATLFPQAQQLTAPQQEPRPQLLQRL